MLHAKFQVSGCPETCFTKIQIWPKSAVNRVLTVYRPGKCYFFLYLDLISGLCRAIFSSVFGLPYRLASLLIYQTCYLIYQQNLTQNIKIVHITVTTPGITGPSSYEISGTSVTLSCGTISDSSGTGTYVWKFERQVQYVFVLLGLLE